MIRVSIYFFSSRSQQPAPIDSFMISVLRRNAPVVTTSAPGVEAGHHLDEVVVRLARLHRDRLEQTVPALHEDHRPALCALDGFPRDEQSLRAPR